MSQNGLLVLDFDTYGGNEYVYDGVTNRVFFTPRPMRRMIHEYREKERQQMISELSGSYATDLLDDYYEQITRWVDFDGAFFLKERVPTPSVTRELDMRRRKELRTPHLVLVVTMNCNMACKYCKQDRTGQSMTFDVAREGIDRFFEQNANPDRNALDRVSLGFYGGEPLLEFDLVRKCVTYVESEVQWPAPRHFSVTTNGTLLKDDIVDYLVEKQFDVSISLDGPRHEHDRNRVTKAGKGTFDLVLDNLARIRERYPEYYKVHMQIISTFDFASDLVEALHWFDENRAELPRLVRSALASLSDEMRDSFTCDAKQRFRRQQRQMYAVMKEELTSDPRCGKLRRSWLQVLGAKAGSLADKRHSPAWRKWKVGCYPGLARLALYPDGTFHVCERVENARSIGDIHVGIDINKVKSLVSEFATRVVAEEDCYSCIAQQMCDRCYLGMDEQVDGRDPCGRERTNLDSQLRYWYTIFERNPNLVVHLRTNRYARETILDTTL